MRMFVAVPLMALLLAAGAAHSADSIPADSASTTASDDAVAADDPAEEAVNPAWQAYRARIMDVLRASDSPRDWALAAKFSLDEDSGALSRAAEAATDDALVQWLVANSGTRDNPASRTIAEAAANRLVSLEPDNGAAWLVVLVLADQRGDHTAVADSLARMAASTRFDAHYADALHAWLPIFDRYPPDDLMDDASLQEGSSPSFFGAVTAAQVMAMPAYLPLLKVCREEHASADIRLSCRDAGRLMLHESNTLIARNLGFGIMRTLDKDELSDADRELKRDDDWYQWRGLVAYATGDSEAERRWNAAFEAAWRDQSSEIVAIQQALKAVGQPTEPPPGWSKPKDPWSKPAGS